MEKPKVSFLDVLVTRQKISLHRTDQELITVDTSPQITPPSITNPSSRGHIKIEIFTTNNYSNEEIGIRPNYKKN